ncbi:carbon monoxide dehydrogenase subunit G [Cereibacter sphaeroides]|uniref:CoxG family protein n=1 Tax=Rhodobacterales TaxID=204455 RepID=UPI000BBEE0B7|nr:MULTISPECIES: carbon monoxide dehydrogenase subunit G [Paracoccaceae]MCE6952817.1 carbon monoxide dehydrogenase subunit G [Cereibacter sphaeroides]MCE6962085.1 carbon monoxide dehydrogenase subunit G [Cereibacter sphaeroides]MCE6970860.1 carbon monoxide dehydrogenase subunit G [Cereibacter sphaeroides]MCE6975544.1 carbon monoxide dehydrogenase subunit G [Cereibacter sphaeroides]
MQLTDQRNISADPDTVWAAILDPEVLRVCIPGCESLSGSPEAGYEAIVVQKVGPVKARFTGHVTLSDIVPGQSLTITGEGKGGAAGFARGSAKVTLTPADGGTALSSDVDVHVGGKLAQLGSRIIDGFARKTADQFFERFQSAVEGPADDDAPEAEAVAVGAEGEAPAKKGWFKRMMKR